MSARNKRKELLLSTWIRKIKCAHVPSELIAIIILFGQGVVKCSYKGTQFNDLFSPHHDSAQFPYAWEDCFVKTLDIEGLRFKLTATRYREGYLYISLDLDTISSFIPRVVSSITITVTIAGNIHELERGPFVQKYENLYECARLRSTVLSIDQKICMDICLKYDEFDVKFFIDIIDIECRRMKVNQRLIWRLSQSDRAKLIEGEDLSLCTKVNDWTLFIIQNGTNTMFIGRYYSNHI